MALPLPRLPLVARFGVAGAVALLFVPCGPGAGQAGPAVHRAHPRSVLPRTARPGARTNASAQPPPMLNISGNGVAVDGTSAEESGIVGTTDAMSASAIYAGVYGVDNTNNSGTGNNVGVFGVTSNGSWGVEGDSNNGANGGVYGDATTGYGVEGYTASGAAGVYGTTPSGYGVYGASNASTGVLGLNTFAMSSVPYENIGVEGSSTNGSGVLGVSTNGDGVYAYSGAGTGAFIENVTNLDPTLTIEYASTDSTDGQAINVFNNSTGDYMVLDALGNLTLSGSVTANKGDAMFTRTRNPNSDEELYGSQEAEAITEDVGSAQLVNGAAAVRLGADFKQTIEDSSAYMVFLTPYGDTNGLYVASRTPAGFVVRESRGGRSTVAFDYRIVARPYGARMARLPHVAANPHLRGRRSGGPRLAPPHA